MQGKLAWALVEELDTRVDQIQKRGVRTSRARSLGKLICSIVWTISLAKSRTAVLLRSATHPEYRKEVKHSMPLGVLCLPTLTIYPDEYRKAKKVSRRRNLMRTVTSGGTEKDTNGIPIERENRLLAERKSPPLHQNAYKALKRLKKRNRGVICTTILDLLFMFVLLTSSE